MNSNKTQDQAYAIQAFPGGQATGRHFVVASKDAALLIVKAMKREPGVTSVVISKGDNRIVHTRSGGEWTATVEGVVDAYATTSTTVEWVIVHRGVRRSKFASFEEALPAVVGMQADPGNRTDIKVVGYRAGANGKWEVVGGTTYKWNTKSEGWDSEEVDATPRPASSPKAASPRVAAPASPLPTPAPRKAKGVVVGCSDDMDLEFRGEFKKVLADVKRLPGRQWDATSKCWFVPHASPIVADYMARCGHKLVTQHVEAPVPAPAPQVVAPSPAATVPDSGDAKVRITIRTMTGTITKTLPVLKGIARLNMDEYTIFGQAKDGVTIFEHEPTGAKQSLKLLPAAGNFPVWDAA